MAVKSKSKKPAVAKPSPQQKGAKPAKKVQVKQEEPEEDDDSEEEPSFVAPKGGKLLKVKKEKEPEPESDEEDEEEEDDDDDEDDEEMEEDDSEEEEEDEDEEMPAEVPSKPLKRKAEDKKAPAEDEEDEELKNTVFVSHIFNVKNDVLTEYFGKAGKIQSIRSIARKGYAFLRFADSESVEKALAMDGQEWNGKNIIVQRAKSKKSDAKKRKADSKQGGPQAKKAKPGGKIVSLKPGQKGSKGKPKTPQKPNPNKKKNKPKPGAFVKAT